MEKSAAAQEKFVKNNKNRPVDLTPKNETERLTGGMRGL